MGVILVTGTLQYIHHKHSMRQPSQNLPGEERIVVSIQTTTVVVEQSIAGALDSVAKPGKASFPVNQDAPLAKHMQVSHAEGLHAV